MIDDDDLFVVIVDDGNKDAKAEEVHNDGSSHEDSENDWTLERKNHRHEEIDVDVENILYAAQEYGEILHFDEVSERNKWKGLKGKNEKKYYDTILDDDTDDFYYEPQFVFEDDENSAYSTDGDTDKVTIKETHWRHKNRVMVSNVQKLREKFPHLRENKEYLIQAIANKMKNECAPDPPSDCIIYDDDIYRCKYCSTECSSQSIALRHYQEKHGERYLTCYGCGATFRWSTCLYKHELLNCQSPDITIILKARALHMKRKGRSRPSITEINNAARRRYSCTLCSATFAHKSSLEPHMCMHRGERPFPCPRCPRAYTSQIAMTHHLKKHGDIKFVCDHCGKVCKEKGKLVVHLATHLPKRKYGCEECPKRYSTKADLTVHVNSDHRNLPLPYDCKICPKRFARMASLKSHMKKSHGMVIITSRMFARQLPEMSEEQLEAQLKQAIVVRKNPETSNRIVQEENYED